MATVPVRYIVNDVAAAIAFTASISIRPGGHTR